MSGVGKNKHKSAGLTKSDKKQRQPVDDSKISKAVLRRVAKNLENHFNYEIQENSFVTRSRSQRESLVLYNFPVTRQYLKDGSGAAPQIVRPKVKKGLRTPLSSPYIRCLVRTANEVVAKYPVRQLEKFHTLPLLPAADRRDESDVADGEGGNDEEGETANGESRREIGRRRQGSSEAAGGGGGVSGCRQASQQSPRRLQNYRPHVANMLDAQHYIEFYSRQEMAHRPVRQHKSQPQTSQPEEKRQKAMNAAKQFM